MEASKSTAGSRKSASHYRVGAQELPVRHRHAHLGTASDPSVVFVDVSTRLWTKTLHARHFAQDRVGVTSGSYSAIVCTGRRSRGGVRSTTCERYGSEG